MLKYPDNGYEKLISSLNASSVPPSFCKTRHLWISLFHEESREIPTTRPLLCVLCETPIFLFLHLRRFPLTMERHSLTFSHIAKYINTWFWIHRCNSCNIAETGRVWQRSTQGNKTRLKLQESASIIYTDQHVRGGIETNICKYVHILLF